MDLKTLIIVARCHTFMLNIASDSFCLNSFGRLLIIIIRVLSFWIKRDYDSKRLKKFFGPYVRFIQKDRTRIGLKKD